ncbi:transposase [Alloacidobacterium dinghuense]|uniref:Transposase n=1 Tax=Alloacidobacterium dinghuense TaxID=2763107 RepID=A0A7G8BFI4_9BACT|nr:transposase [Alloacidobacterium dinghuense]QNI31304.1 transposase [Alloacidobacterium dinghuense]
MGGDEEQQSGMFSYVTMEAWIAWDHPARQIRSLVDRAWQRMDGELGKLYASTGRPSIAPERLLRAQLLLAVVEEARAHQWLSEAHFTVDGTLIQAWASTRSFQPKKEPPQAGSGTGDGGRIRLRDKVESRTDPDARLYRKAAADRSVPSYLGHALMENRSGLVIAAEASLAATDAERRAAIRLLDRGVARPAGGRFTLGADTQYQAAEFIQALRERSVAPHVSEYVHGNLGKNHLTAAERSDPWRSVSQRKRKLIERVFAWSKLHRGLRQVKLRGLERVDWFYRLTIAAYNLVRMRRLIPMQSMAA